MADSGTKIGLLDKALDSYLSKIEKVRLSRATLEDNRGLLEHVLSLLDDLDKRIAEAASAGNAVGQSLLEDLSKSLLSDPGRVRSLLQSAGRMSSLGDGSGVSFSRSESDSLLGAAAEVQQLPKEFFSGLDDIRKQLSLLMSWSGMPAKSLSSIGVRGAMQSSAFNLGRALSSEKDRADAEAGVVGRSGRAGKAKDEDSLSEYVTAQGNEAQFDEVVTDVHNVSEAILAKLQDDKSSSLPAVLQMRSDSSKKPKREDDGSSWWSTLFTVGAVGGGLYGLYKLFSDEGTLKFIQQNILDPDGRKKFFGEAIDSVKSYFERFLSWGQGIKEKIEEVYNWLRSPADRMKEYTSKSVSLYNTPMVEGGITPSADVRTQQDVAAMTASMESTSVKALGIDTMSGGWDTIKNVALAGGGLAAMNKILPGATFALAKGAGKGIMLTGNLLWKALKALFLTGPQGVVIGALGAVGGKYLIDYLKDRYEVKQVNKLVLAACLEEGVQFGYFFTDNWTQEYRSIYSLEGEDGTRVWDTLSDKEKEGVAFAGILEQKKHYEDLNREALVEAYFASRPDAMEFVDSLSSGGESLGDLLKYQQNMAEFYSKSPEEQAAFVQSPIFQTAIQELAEKGMLQSVARPEAFTTAGHVGTYRDTGTGRPLLVFTSTGDALQTYESIYGGVVSGTPSEEKALAFGNIVLQNVGNSADRKGEIMDTPEIPNYTTNVGQDGLMGWWRSLRGKDDRPAEQQALSEMLGVDSVLEGIASLKADIEELKQQTNGSTQVYDESHSEIKINISNEQNGV